MIAKCEKCEKTARGYTAIFNRFGFTALEHATVSPVCRRCAITLPIKQIPATSCAWCGKQLAKYAKYRLFCSPQHKSLWRAKHRLMLAGNKRIK